MRTGDRTVKPPRKVAGSDVFQGQNQSNFKVKSVLEVVWRGRVMLCVRF